MRSQSSSVFFQSPNSPPTSAIPVQLYYTKNKLGAKKGVDIALIGISDARKRGWRVIEFVYITTLAL